MSTAAQRLQRAMRASGVSQTGLAAAMAPKLKKRRIQGASQGAVSRYVNGKREPSGPWLEVAAEVLGVRPAWMVRGEGQMTPDEAAVDLTAQGESAREFEARMKAVLAAREVIGSRLHVGSAVDAVVYHLLRRIEDAAPDADPLDEEMMERLAHAVADLIQTPAAVLVPVRQRPATMSGPQWSDYVVSMVAAILHVVPPVGEGYSLEEIVGERDESGEK